jgi:transposase
MVAADARTAITFALLPGQAHDAAEGHKLLSGLGKPRWPVHLLMDRAYEGNETRQLELELGFIPVVPPKSNRIEPWEYDKAMYRRRCEIERLFRKLKGFAYLLSLRETRCDVYCLHSLRFDR